MDDNPPELLIYNLDPDVKSPSVIIDIADNNVTMLDYIQMRNSKIGISHMSVEPTSITVDGNDGFKYATSNPVSGLEDESAVFVHDDKIFNLIITSKEGIDNMAFFDHILESIEFK